MGNLRNKALFTTMISTMNSFLYTILLIIGIDGIFYVAEKIIKFNNHIAVAAFTTIILYILGVLFSAGVIYFSTDTVKEFYTLDYLFLFFNIIYAWWRITDRIQKLNRRYGNV